VTTRRSCTYASSLDRPRVDRVRLIGFLLSVSIVKFASLHIVDRLTSTVEYTNLESYSLVWLDPSGTEMKHFADVQQRLRASINYLKVFKTSDECHAYLRLVPEHDRVVLLVNSQYGREFLVRVHSARQVCSIYVHNNDNAADERWKNELDKVNALDACGGRRRVTDRCRCAVFTRNSTR
jgi:hypothetical protein